MIGCDDDDDDDDEGKGIVDLVSQYDGGNDDDKDG